MELVHRTRLARTNDTATADSAPALGKHTLTEQLPVQRREGATPPGAESGASTAVPSTPAPLLGGASSRPRPTLQMLFGVQRAAAGAPAAAAATVHAAAARGTATPASKLPHADRIQRAFGRHDISGIQAHAGGDAAASAHAMGASAYATGNHVVLGSPDLHTVAHEAAHVVQQRAGVSLKDGVGDAGDRTSNTPTRSPTRWWWGATRSRCWIAIPQRAGAGADTAAFSFAAFACRLCCSSTLTGCPR